MKTINIIFILFLSLSCTKKKDSSQKNELNLALTSKVSTLDPALSYDTVSAKVVYQIYETLFEYEFLMRPYQLKASLAQEMPLIEDGGLKYTIKIKKNIQYHPHASFGGKNRFVKAQDFVNQIKRLAYTPGSNGWWLFKNKVEGLDEFKEQTKNIDDFFKNDIAGLKATDDQTLVIKLKKPYPQLIYALSMVFTTPIPEEIIRHYNNELNHEPVGTGPYQFVSWIKNSKIELKKFAGYREVKYPSNGDRFANQNNLLNDRAKIIPFVEKVNFYIITEAQTRWLKFLNKEIDIMTLNKDHFPLALNDSGKLNDEYKKQNIKLQISPTLTYWWLSFNMQHPILGKNLKLRQAIAHSINIDEYIKKFTNNIALKANSIYPPGVKGYSPSNKLPYEFDLDKAKKLINEAGYPEGKGLPKFKYDVRSSSTVARQMGEFIQKEVQKIGVNIEIVQNTFPGFLNKARTSQLEIWQGGWSMDYPDLENVAQLLYSKNHAPGPNASLYNNPKVDELYEQIAVNQDIDQSVELGKKLEKIVTEEIPWVMQYYSRNYILYHGNISNFRHSDLIPGDLKYLKVE